jgi:hypothetical protein
MANNTAATNLWKSFGIYTLTYTVARGVKSKLFVINGKLADAADSKADAIYLISLSK